jgi:hypothetical protein
MHPQYGHRLLIDIKSAVESSPSNSSIDCQHLFHHSVFHNINRLRIETLSCLHFNIFSLSHPTWHMTIHNVAYVQCNYSFCSLSSALNILGSFLEAPLFSVPLMQYTHTINKLLSAPSARLSTCSRIIGNLLWISLDDNRGCEKFNFFKIR